MNHISYNINTLKGFCNNDDEAIKAFLGSYIVNAKTDLQELIQHFEAKSFDQVKNTAHKMKNIISLLSAEPCSSNLDVIMNWEKEITDEFNQRVRIFIENVQILFQKIQKDYQI